MRRREFVLLLCGSAAAWPLAARAQQPAEGMRRIGVVAPLPESDAEGRARIAALRKRLEDLGWTEGRNLWIDYRATDGNADRARAYAAELVALKPDVIVVAASTEALLALQAQTRTIPIVFTQIADPVAAGFVASWARPGGNVTGFGPYEFAIAAKWPELLKQLAPGVTCAGILYDPGTTNSVGYMPAIEVAASSLGMELSRHAARSAAEIELAVSQLAAKANVGLIVVPGSAPVINRELIVALERRHRLPAVHGYRYFVALGGLASYGVDNIDLYRQAASYVHRILKGEKPADLPVQAATRFELVINLGTAKTLGLTVPDKLLVAADEVIE